MPHNRRLSGFFNGKAGFVGTVLSTRSALWTSNMPKMRWRPGLSPGPHWGAYDAPPDPLVGWVEGHPSPIPTLSAPRASVLPQCKILATPLITTLVWATGVVIKAYNDWRGIRRPQVAMHLQMAHFLVSFFLTPIL